MRCSFIRETENVGVHGAVEIRRANRHGRCLPAILKAQQKAEPLARQTGEVTEQPASSLHCNCGTGTGWGGTHYLTKRGLKPDAQSVRDRIRT